MSGAEILNFHKLKRTSCREGILKVMLSSKQALSEGEIRDNLKGHYDRTTFYRSFKTLEAKRIIHKVVVDNLFVKYALGNTLNPKKMHAHFFCKDCNSVECLNNTPIPTYPLPDGYTYSDTEVIIKGSCAKCNQ
ncbi:Fur family transcriptional regulator [Cyclobacterium marinum]|uniref:Fur family transcriptional regulator n=1 Tax=Cyclobacterium marinum TaxID=104 RepID=UPI0011EDA500|nr:transcriptional repressor [Cyclobacterium marinum]MBI0401557.1 transcriptional repressor [Cyclobacterium marinum]